MILLTLWGSPTKFAIREMKPATRAFGWTLHFCSQAKKHFSPQRLQELMAQNFATIEVRTAIDPDWNSIKLNVDLV